MGNTCAGLFILQILSMEGMCTHFCGTFALLLTLFLCTVSYKSNAPLSLYSPFIHDVPWLLLRGYLRRPLLLLPLAGNLCVRACRHAEGCNSHLCSVEPVAAISEYAACVAGCWKYLNSARLYMGLSVAGNIWYLLLRCL